MGTLINEEELETTNPDETETQDTPAEPDVDTDADLAPEHEGMPEEADPEDEDGSDGSDE